MAKPNFIGIGAEKSGTTSLWLLLRQHQDIFLYERKETLFFSRTLQFTSPHHYEWTLFKNYAGQRAIGEISPEYMRAPRAAALVREALGPIKIIVCLREPTRRAFSHYLLCLRLAEEDMSFADACRRDAILPLWSGSFLDFRRAYVRGSWYAYQLDSWRREFGIENMFFCILERDMKDPESVANMLKRLFRFLDVSDTATINLTTPNTSGGAPSVTVASDAGVVKYSEDTDIRFEAGDILFQTGNVAMNQILRRPSPELRSFITRMMHEMTPYLSSEDEQRFRAKYFASVLEQTAEIIGENLSEVWRDRLDTAISGSGAEKAPISPMS